MTYASNLDVIIIHHPTDNMHRPIYFTAMGLLSIADQLDKNGFETQIIHLGVERELNQDFDPVSYISSTGAKKIGISGHWFFQLPESLNLAKKIKDSIPNIIIVMGGFSASFFSEEIIRDHPHVDVVIKGDGETPFVELCKLIKNNSRREWKTVPNIVYRGPNGRLEVTPFKHTNTDTQLNKYNFSRFHLMKNHNRYLEYSSFWTRRFRDNFKDGGLFPLEIGRGCPHLCTFCGGNAKAQIAINNRRKPIFRSVENVITTIEEVITYGYKNFYICFDPYPNDAYYFDLFREIRKKKLEIRLCFGSWRLPSEQFIDEFSRTFPDGIIEISPETSSESLRNLNKETLSYSNRELEKTLKCIKRNGLLCQLYFGYFLPGDTVQSVNQTLKYARDLDSDFCETFYLPLSTDPASLFYFSPDKYQMNVRIKSLQDYIDALSKRRISSNLLEHKPETISQDEAESIIAKINTEHLLHNVLPSSLKALMSLWNTGHLFSSRMEIFYSTIDGLPQIREKWDIVDLINLFKKFVKSKTTDKQHKFFSILKDIIKYESMPYLLQKRYLSGNSNHYSFSIQEIKMEKKELNKFMQEKDTIVKTHLFHYDVKSILSEINKGNYTDHRPKETAIGFVLDSKRRYTTFYQKDWVL